MPSIVKNLTESMNNDELDLAFDKARSVIETKVPEDKRKEVLQTIMTTLKEHPDQEDAFISNPTTFGPLASYNTPSEGSKDGAAAEEMAGVDPKGEDTIGKPATKAEPGEDSDFDGIQITYADGAKVLRIGIDTDKKTYLVSANGSKLHKYGLVLVQMDMDTLVKGKEFSLLIDTAHNPYEPKFEKWNSHSPITDIEKVKISEAEVSEAIDRKTEFKPTTAEPAAADVGTPESKEDAEPEDPKTPDEIDKAKETELDKLAVQYPVISNCIKQRFRNVPEDGEKVAAMLNKILNGAGVSAEKWNNYITDKAKKGQDRAIIQNKIIPTIANACGVDVPRQVNDDQRDTLKDRNGNSVGSIVIPEGFNQAPIELGDQVMSMDFGYPAINFNSELIRQILHTDPASNPKQLKKLLKALMNRVNGSPAGQALLQEFIFSFSLTKTTGGVKRSQMYKLIKNAASAEGIPMLRRPLKVESENLVGNSEAKTIKVVPLNALAKDEPEPKPKETEAPATESISWLDANPILESEFWFSKNNSEDTQKMYGDPVDLPALYLKQFYTVLVPSGPTGLHNYARYMSAKDSKNLAKRLGKEAIEEIKTANHNVNDMILQKYIEENDGVPPFYILKPRTKPSKERLRVCDDTKVNGRVCIKSIDGKNKAAYFMEADKIDSVFEAG